MLDGAAEVMRRGGCPGDGGRGRVMKPREEALEMPRADSGGSDRD